MLIIVLILILHDKDTAIIFIVQVFCVLFYIYFVISVTKAHNCYIISALHIIFFRKKRDKELKNVFASRFLVNYLNL